MEYNFQEIEQKWKKAWKDQHIYRVANNPDKPKYYVLDMFPYPSGAGLHVGHPLGYLASDIVARYKRLKGFNVLHPMGFDAFGLPAEQYALETGKHPADTTEENIKRYKEQLDNIGFCYDWEREVRTSDPQYYKWTQWIFLQLFHSWYDRKEKRARNRKDLIVIFEREGNLATPAPGIAEEFNAETWKQYDEKQKRKVLMEYRLAYLSYAEVWWCEALGTVLANDEVVNGVSERGAHPVEKKKMRQWFLRITDYADRLLDALTGLYWSDAMKEMQRNWIGKSEGASVFFELSNADEKIEVFTTRPDTIFGVDFMVLAPEHALVAQITTDQAREKVEQYIGYVKSRSERERMTEVKQVSGVFTGAFAIHPFTGRKIPVYIAEYVLAGYGTGAIMAVPSGDDRDHAFARHFEIPITNVFGPAYTGDQAYTAKEGTIFNSDFLDGLEVKAAISKAIEAIEQKGIGKKKVNYKLRDAGFSRQRYWGEPFPVIYQEDQPYTIEEITKESLPVTLPMVRAYKPGPEGQGPLANVTDWVGTDMGLRETNTMPGYAGSSWYFLRYMDPHNQEEFASKAATDYWNQVDLYVGGTEHAVGHLLYSRFWTKVLYDLEYLSFDEPFKKLLNQGMIQGSSRFIYRSMENNTFCSYDELKNQNSKEFVPIHVDVNLVDGIQLNLEKFKEWRTEYKESGFILNEHQEFLCGTAIEKMSKSKYNVVNPDDIVAQYGADTFRMYEMFLGPIDVSKPWDTKGIEGVHRFLKKLWRLFAAEDKILLTDAPADKAELKLLHKHIQKISSDMEQYSFNTSVSQFMILVNELSALNCHKKEILQPVVITLAPFAPHMAEELWKLLGEVGSVLDARFPDHDPALLVEQSKLYPVAINGKPRAEMEFALDADPKTVEAEVLANEKIRQWMEGKPVKKFIYVKGKMINVVV